MNRFLSFIKEQRVWGTLLGVVIIAIISLAYFSPDVFEGNILRQHDMQQGLAIGQEAKAYTEATGEPTRWTNSLFSGMPTFQISPTYPSNSLFSWIGSIMGLGLPSPANLVAMMMLGFFILLVTMRMRLPVALIGAVAYGFSTYFIIIIGAGHIWKFVTLAYVPPTIAGLILCYRGRYLAGAAMTALFGMMQIAANHVQMTYYFLFVVVGLMIAYLIQAFKDKKLRRWLIATASLAVAGLLAVTANLPSLYNTYEYSKETIRGNHSDLTDPSAANNPNATDGGLNRDYITQYSYNIPETWTLLIPNVNGGASMKPEKGGNKLMNLYDLPGRADLEQSQQLDYRVSPYLQYITQYYGAPEGTNGPVYVGALIFALFLLGCIIVKGPVKWTLIVLTLLSIALAWGRYFMGLTDFMIDHMPMYSKFRTPESILVIAEFTMPLLAAMALQKLFTAGKEMWNRYGKAILGSFGFTLVVCLFAWMSPGSFGSAIPDHEMRMGLSELYSYAPIRAAVEHLRYSLVKADALRSLLIVGFGLIVIVLYGRRKMNGWVALACLAAIVTVDMLSVNKRYLDHDSFIARPLFARDEFPMSDADRLILSDTTAHYRVMDIPHFWEAAPSYRHKTIGGYHAAKLTRYQDLIDRHISHFTDGHGADSIDWEILSMLNARYIVVDTAVALNPDARGNAWFVDRIAYVDNANAEMDALSEINLQSEAVADKRFESTLGSSSAATPGDTVFLTSYAPNRLTYSATSARGGVAVFSEVFFPWGWTATIDGAPAEIGRVNYLLRAVTIPAGHHTVEMRFDPVSLHTTGTAATIAVIIIYLICIAAIALYFISMRRSAKVVLKE